MHYVKECPHSYRKANMSVCMQMSAGMRKCVFTLITTMIRPDYVPFTFVSQTWLNAV